MPANLTTSPLKLLLASVMSLIAIFTLGSDFFSWMDIKKNEQTLQQLQIQKENTLTQKMETSQQEARMNPLIFLNPSEAALTLARVCETSHLFLAKIQLEKTPAKIKQNTFEVSLDLMGDYFAFMDFFNQSMALSWNIDWQTLHIASTHLKAKKKTSHSINPLYPLEIKLRLIIAHYYDPNKKISPFIQASKQSSHTTCSPFVMQRHAGKLITEGKITDIIVTEEGKNGISLLSTK